MSIKEIITCDICRKDIDNNEAGDSKNTDDLRVNAQVYGVDFHLKCLRDANVLDVLNVLGLDEISLINFNGDNHKLIYWYQQNYSSGPERKFIAQTCGNIYAHNSHKWGDHNGVYSCSGRP